MSEIVDRIGKLIRSVEVCGLSVDGQTVFCDDGRLPDNVKENECACKIAASLAVKASIEHLRDNVSDSQNNAGHEAFEEYGTQYDGRRESIAASAPIYMLKAMLSQALKEIEEG